MSSPRREPEIAHPPPDPVLQVYVADGCGSCRRARELVAQLLLRHPGAAVEVVDLSRTPLERALPAGLVGTPTYTVDGRVRWLGNPSPAELLALVERRRN
ncbi:glutaredoxin family protein [Blastococcus saxobsidens]|uniref:Putative Thioredoxin n=1 Tax=Blastococcus saxobsidens (strain DD2) TaxID=1146883 RepID=H6RJI3_BLASD|nr:thioredoxin family protein [Blastococcus saxobsidens]CCG02288.1 Putative Thioredoxin [Blastococcus saxobsidens DD2]